MCARAATYVYRILHAANIMIPRSLMHVLVSLNVFSSRSNVTNNREQHGRKIVQREEEECGNKRKEMKRRIKEEGNTVERGTRAGMKEKLKEKGGKYYLFLCYTNEY